MSNSTESLYPDGRAEALTPASIRCLLAILKRSRESRDVATRSVAEELGVKPPSVVRVVELLQKDGLIHKEPYGKIELTADGRRMAIRLYRRVRRIQSILIRQLGLCESEGLQAALLFVTSLEEKSQLSMIAHVRARRGGDSVMPLSLAVQGEENIIRRISGNAEVKKHLSDLGFVVGGSVSVVTQTAGNLIVNVKESRIAISCEMAQKIMI